MRKFWTVFWFLAVLVGLAAIVAGLAQGNLIGIIGAILFMVVAWRMARSANDDKA